jgi:RNA polymerase sigma factor (sigma-70 family)
MTDDLTFLRRYVENQADEAFAELVQRHLPLVYTAALRRTNGDAHRAQDVSQIVFTALAREATVLLRHPSLVGWLYTATRNAAAALMRAEQRRHAREQEAHVMNEILSPTEPAADWERLRPVLDDALDNLEPSDREAVLLRFFHQQQFAAVAAALRVSEDAARKRVDRALDRLAAFLGQRGITSTTGALALALGQQAAFAVPATAAAAITSAALASASAAGGSVATATVLTLMTTGKIITGTAVAVAVLAIGTAIYQTRAAHESSTSADALQQQRAALSTQIAALENRLQQSDQNLAVARKELSERRTGAGQAANAPLAQPAQLQHGSTIDYVLAHPETHAAYIERQALRALARYDHFLKTAGLSAEQQDRFAKGVKDVAAADFDFMAALHSQGYGVGNLPTDANALRELQRPGAEKKKQFFEETRAMLGDERTKRFADAFKATPERNVADQLAGRLYYTESALTAQQADQLVKILGGSRLNPQAQGTPESTMNATPIAPRALQGALAQALQQGGLSLLDWHAPVSDAALAKASSVLSPVQLAALKRVQAEQVTQLQLAPPPPAGFLGGPR